MPVLLSLLWFLALNSGHRKQAEAAFLCGHPRKEDLDILKLD